MTESTDTFAGGRTGHRPAPVVELPGWKPQLALQLDHAEHVIVGGIPQPRPMLGAHTTSVAYARSWSTATGLQAATSVTLGATARWLPDVADVVARPDLGSDVSLWQPHAGSAPAFTLHTPSAPYVDPDYRYVASSGRTKTVAAMVFEGDRWAQFRGGAGQAAFTWVMVLALRRPRINGWADLLASPSTATDPLRATDAVLRYRDGWLEAHVGGRMSRTRLHPPVHHRLRPSVVLWSEGARTGTLGVVDAHGRHFHTYRHPLVTGYDGRFFLGVNGSFPDPSYAADIDLLDLAYYDHQVGLTQLKQDLRRLEHAYGVHGQ